MKNLGCLLYSTVFFLLSSLPAIPEIITIEGESFSNFKDTSLVSIKGISGPSCSGGEMLVGLDYPQEWTEYRLTVNQTDLYRVQLTGRGDKGKQYQLKLTLSPESLGEPQTVEFAFKGKGYG